MFDSVASALSMFITCRNSLPDTELQVSLLFVLKVSSLLENRF